LSIDVLVTGSGALLGQGLIKSLRVSSFVNRIIATDLSPMAAGLYLADSAHLLPRFDGPEYVDALIGLAREERVRVILCGTDLEVPVLAKNRAHIEQATGAKLVVSAPPAVSIADDKWLTVEFLRGAGFDAPRSALTFEAAKELAREVGWPLIVKPRIGAGSVGLSKAHDEDALRRAMETPGVIAQEYLRPDDEEYTIGTLVIDERCHAVVPLWRTLRHGNTHTAISDNFPEIRDFSARVVEKLPGAFGPINLQLRATARGPVVFEINARFSGTTPLRAEFGFNEVEAMLRYVIDGTPIPAPVLRHGLILRWTAELFVPLEELRTMRETRHVETPSGALLGAEPRARRSRTKTP
jgi:carbamoyl-phosphate synthase large subunit